MLDQYSWLEPVAGVSKSMYVEETVVQYRTRGIQSTVTFYEERVKKKVSNVVVERPGGVLCTTDNMNSW